jgi:hypothetical protein
MRLNLAFFVLEAFDLGRAVTISIASRRGMVKRNPCRTNGLYNFPSHLPPTQSTLPPMAKNPLQFNPKAAAIRVRAAFAAAQARTGNEGQLVALSAGGLLLAFVLLAIVAPFVMRAPGFVSVLTGVVLFGLVVIATGIGIVALWRMIKAGAMEGSVTASKTEGGIFSQSAVQAALSDAEDAGLRAISPRDVSEAMTGRIAGRAIAVMVSDGATFGVMRLAQAASATLLLTPNEEPWPFAIPADGTLVPIGAPKGVVALAWTTQREIGLALMHHLAPALVMSQAGGAVPFVSVRGRALVLMWPKGDVGTACVIMGEMAKGFGE